MLKQLTLILLVIACCLTNLKAQSPSNLDRLYEQASEVSGIVIRYQSDVRAIQYAYGPIAGGRSTGLPNVYSPEQLDRLQRLDRDYLAELDTLDFDSYSIHGQVDYVLLKRKIKQSLQQLAVQEQAYQQIKPHIPFADIIYDFERQRRRGAAVSGQDVAQRLHDAQQSLSDAREQFNHIESLEEALADYLEATIADLRARLRSAFDFYNGYDPQFTWWVPEPYKALDVALSDYAMQIKGKSNATVFDDGSEIGGKPIGHEQLSRLLQEEMIPYTPEELLRLAEQEFAWCEDELLKASCEMG